MKISRTRNKRSTHVNVIIEGVKNQEELEIIAKGIREVLRGQKHQKEISYSIISMDYPE